MKRQRIDFNFINWRPLCGKQTYWNVSVMVADNLCEILKQYEYQQICDRSQRFSWKLRNFFKFSKVLNRSNIIVVLIKGEFLRHFNVCYVDMVIITPVWTENSFAVNIHNYISFFLWPEYEWIRGFISNSTPVKLHEEIYWELREFVDLFSRYELWLYISWK